MSQEFEQPKRAEQLLHTVEGSIAECAPVGSDEETWTAAVQEHLEMIRSALGQTLVQRFISSKPHDIEQFESYKRHPSPTSTESSSWPLPPWHEEALLGRNEKAIEDWKGKAIRALAKQYESYGCVPEDFCYITYMQEDGGTANAIVYAKPEGIDLRKKSGQNPKSIPASERSYYGIQKSSLHDVVINGVEQSARMIDFTMYRALLKHLSATQGPVRIEKSRGWRASDWARQWSKPTVLTGKDVTEYSRELRYPHCYTAYVDKTGEVCLEPLEPEETGFARFRPAVIFEPDRFVGVL